MDRFARTIKKARTERNETRKELAKIIKCKESFVRHIEQSSVVPVSERIVKALKKHFREYSKAIDLQVKRRNEIGKKYQREYRKNKKAA